MNILITGAWNHTSAQRQTLERMGHTVLFLQNEQDALPVPYEEVEGVICNGLFLHHPIERFTNLQYIQVTSAGLDRVPVAYVQEHGIQLFNARGVYSIPMAEFALAGVLQLYKQAAFFHENQKEHRWNKHRGLLELYGKTVCILGCGNVGTECAKRFRAFGCRVIGVDQSVWETPDYDEMLLQEQLPRAAQQADVLVVTVALTEQTRGMINAALLNATKPGCVIVNLSRGAVVDTAALAKALRDKKVSAVLDVFDEEPLAADHPLWEMDNVVLTPHNSFVGDGNADRLWGVIYGNLKELYLQELNEIFHGNEETINSFIESLEHPETLHTLTSWDDLFDS